jgi:hypothetical protein
VISFSRKHHLPITFSVEHEAPTFNLNWSIELCKVNARWINLSISYFCFWLCMGSFSTSLFTWSFGAEFCPSAGQSKPNHGTNWAKFRNNYCVALRQWKRIKNHRSSCLSKQLGSTVSHRQTNDSQRSIHCKSPSNQRFTKIHKPIKMFTTHNRRPFNHIPQTKPAMAPWPM